MPMRSEAQYEPIDLDVNLLVESVVVTTIRRAEVIDSLELIKAPATFDRRPSILRPQAALCFNCRQTRWRANPPRSIEETLVEKLAELKIQPSLRERILHT